MHRIYAGILANFLQFTPVHVQKFEQLVCETLKLLHIGNSILDGTVHTKNDSQSNQITETIFNYFKWQGLFFFPRRTQILFKLWVAVTDSSEAGAQG